MSGLADQVGPELHLGPAPVVVVMGGQPHGRHPILMDFGLVGGVNPPDPSAGGPMSYAAFEPARYAMGDTLRFAERIQLIEMEPRAELSSTGYALANPGQE